MTNPPLDDATLDEWERDARIGSGIVAPHCRILNLISALRHAKSWLAEAKDKMIESVFGIEKAKNLIIELDSGVRASREEVSRLRGALERIQGSCGVPDAAEACRIILKLSKEALAWKPEGK